MRTPRPIGPNFPDRPIPGPVRPPSVEADGAPVGGPRRPSPAECAQDENLAVKGRSNRWTRRARPTGDWPAGIPIVSSYPRVSGAAAKDVPAAGRPSPDIETRKEFYVSTGSQIFATIATSLIDTVIAIFLAIFNAVALPFLETIPTLFGIGA